jgi:thiamine kinase-like enzyme
LTESAPLAGEVADLVRRTHDLLAPLRSVALPAVFEHADLSHPNLFLPVNGELQVVDWERASADGLPGHDLIFYLQYLGESVVGAFTRDSQVSAFDRTFGPGGWAHAVIREHLQGRGVDPDLLPLLLLVTWARSTGTLAARLAPVDRRNLVRGESQRSAALSEDRDFWLWRHVVGAASKYGLG